ncbi:MAG: glycoside hydrolase family 2 TIM barrel-domain containing protein [Mariniphaga sp.]
MRNPFISSCLLLALCFSVSAQKKGFLNNLPQYIENTSVFELNQEEGRAYYIPEKNLSLNGKWKFFYSDTPDGIPQDFYTAKFNDTKWSSIDVPGNWEMKGFGDKLFRNVRAPYNILAPKDKSSRGFGGKPQQDFNPFGVSVPYVPKEYNPTGAYRMSFNLPANFKGGQTFLRFEKVASASFVWVNGQEVGYNEGAQEPSEYNVSKYLRPGKNTVAVLVLKYSDGYYLEGQDYWRLAGIFDNVWLYSSPNERLFDWQVITDLDAKYADAKLDVKVDVKKYKESAASVFTVKAQLFDSGNKLVTEFSSEKVSLDKLGKTQFSLEKSIINPRKWTSETPNLYTLKMQLLAEDGSIKDRSETRIGFKKTEIRGETFFLNGIPVKVNAQNSHMQHPELGHTMNEETIRKDFEILKQFNFNAVRTSHYPPVTKYLELADEYGLFIIDEAGVESHATEYVSTMPEFKEMYKERVRQMVLRDRNHPCILFWSSGNESGEGSNITEVVKEGRKYDPTRYWMYGGNAYSHPAEDIIGPRYPSPMELEMQVAVIPDSSDSRPSFMDEYLSVAGNGGGGLDDYWRVIYSHPRTMGGAIWDFVSPGLKESARLITDSSPNNTPAHLMGNAKLVKGVNGNVLDLNGHDQWVEVYRQNNVEIRGDQLTLTCDVFPRKLVSSCGSFITKGNYQFGLQQRGKDSLDFYIYTDKPYILRTGLPSNWENNWHKLTGVYDGKALTVFIDGKAIASLAASGKVSNFPFPINIGRNAEEHGQETHVYICDAQLDNVGVFNDAVLPGNFDPKKAALWLDFEKESDQGTYFSYGIGARTYGSIWPDRRPQPEMWQMKKSVQPISVKLIDVEKGWAEVWNRNNYLDASNYKTHWSLEADGEVVQEGDLKLQVPAQSKKLIQIPYQKPVLKPGKEYRVTISSSLIKDELWAKAGHEVSWDQLELPWVQKAEELPKEQKTNLDLKQSGNEIAVTGADFKYTFDRKSGMLKSIQLKGKEMLKSPIKLNVWRAPLANEQDNWNSRAAQSNNWKTGFGNQVATEFYSTGLDTLTYYPMSVECKEVNGKVYVDVREICLTGSSKKKEKKDLYVYGIQSNGFENLYSYVISNDGVINLNHKVIPQGNMPLWLPRIGLTLTLGKNLDQVEWYGRGPQENYPDRKTGYKIGIYKTSVKEMYEPYLIPQDYGLRTDNRWMKITDMEGVGINVKMNELFNFNASNYSTENLTKAMYTYQLKEQDGTTLNLDYATSGVGCTARSIFDAYRAMPQLYERQITIVPVLGK